ncbi:MAG: hypothetical protein LBS33_02465 [Streptococcaceae bacterium]|nr:hypothetical protein [Streptococcaceae bacterium]
MEQRKMVQNVIAKVSFPFFADNDVVLFDEGDSFFQDELLITDYSDKFDVIPPRKNAAEQLSKITQSSVVFDQEFAIKNTLEEKKNARAIDLDLAHAKYQASRLNKKAAFVQRRSGIREKKNTVFNPVQLPTKAIAKKPNDLVKKYQSNQEEMTKKQIYSGGLNRFKPRAPLPQLAKQDARKLENAIDESKIKQAFQKELLFDFDAKASEELRAKMQESTQGDEGNIWQVGAPRISAKQKKAIVTATNKDYVNSSQAMVYSGGQSKTIFNTGGYQPVYTQKQRIAKAQDEVAKALHLEQTVDHTAKTKISPNAIERFGKV